MKPKLKLPATVSSLQDVTALELEVREYAKWFAHNAIKERVHAKHGAPAPVISPSAHELIREWSGSKLLTPKDLDALLLALKSFKTTAPSLSITVAAPPTNDVKQKLVTWCRDNVEANILVSFHFNATLLGGMVVRYGSHVFDWSFRRQILANRAAFPEVLRRV